MNRHPTSKGRERIRRKLKHDFMSSPKPGMYIVALPREHPAYEDEGKPPLMLDGTAVVRGRSFCVSEDEAS